MCLPEWVLLVRCRLPRAGLLLINQPERLAAPASASSCSFSSFSWIFFVPEPLILILSHAHACGVDSALYEVDYARVRQTKSSLRPFRLCTCEADSALCILSDLCFGIALCETPQGKHSGSRESEQARFSPISSVVWSACYLNN